MVHARLDPAFRRFVLDDGSIIENLEVINVERHRSSFPVYEFGSSSAVARVDDGEITTISVDYKEPEVFSLKEDIAGWKKEVSKEEIRKISEEIVRDFRR